MSYVSFWRGDAEVLRYPAVLVLSSVSFSDVPVSDRELCGLLAW